MTKPVKIPFFVPWINQEDKKSVQRALGQRWLTNGPILKKFEEKIRRFVGTKYSIGVSSATSGLHLCLRSLGIGSDDEVIVPTFTFVATADVVKYCNAIPILADVDQDTFNIMPQDIKRKITKKTKAVIVVHYGGQSCDMNEIIQLSKKHNFRIIEDCAHALGSTYRKSFCGSIGDAGCFSFYPTKIITTGEGGMITTDNQKIYTKSKLLRSHGMNKTPREREASNLWKYDVMDMGYNYRLDEIRSALGISQFARIKQINQKRIRIAKNYDHEIEKINGISKPHTKKDRNHIYHLYTIKIEDDYHLTRDELFLKFAKKGIGASVQYIPLNMMSYSNNKSKKWQKSFVHANILKDQIMCLPIYPTMTSKEITAVISCLRS